MTGKRSTARGDVSPAAFCGVITLNKTSLTAMNYYILVTPHAGSIEIELIQRK
jgi:hypothetical protein